MPEVTIGKTVVSWQLLVRCRAQVHLLFRKGQAIQKDAPFTVGSDQTIRNYIFIFLIPVHVGERYPASPPACRLQMIREPIRDFTRLI